ncbi:MAG: hypothetical protein ACRDRU_12415 [Pseudonocardiaceae bacterium]
MSGADEPTTGIPNADKPDWWIVPPWSAHASLCDVVNHFLFFSPKDNASITEKLAYYTGHLTAVDAAPRHELKYHYTEHWYEDLRDCIGRCVTLHQDKHATEIQQTHRNLRSFQPAAQAASTSQERAS